MIIDRVRLSGDDAYFKSSDGSINLAATLPSSAQTQPAGRGRQIDVAGIHFYFEGPDLRPYFQRQDKALLRVTVMKEILPGLFADPYRHRVHTIAGFNDFNDGTFNNCQALEVDGEPTIVAMGPGPCSWKSARYLFPQPVRFAKAAWSLVSARSLPNVSSASSFTYSITAEARDENNTLLNLPPVAANLNTDDERSAAFDATGVTQLQFEFRADTSADGYFHERHGSTGLAQIGRPLLRSLQLLEMVKCQHDFFSLSELMSEGAGYDLLGATNDPLTRLAVTLRVPATLVTGPNEDPAQNLYEFVAVDVDPDGVLPDGALTYLSARLSAHVVIRPPATATTR
jgi:hypothetical protein